MSVENAVAVGSDASAGTALLSFHIGDDETLVFWLDAGSAQPHVASAAVGRQEIGAAAAQLRQLFAREKIHFEKPHYTTGKTDMEPRLESLGRRLLEPVAGRLEKCSGLVVAPHGELHALPLHLLAPAGCPPLGVTHSVTYVANLSLYALLLGRAAAHEPAVAMVPSVCLATAAREDADSVREGFALAPRSYAERTGGLFLQGVEATPAAFRLHAGNAGSIYLSCHGCFNEDDSLESSLLLSDGESLPSKVQSGDGLHELSVRNILGARLAARLIILDACMSGLQHLSPGDEPMGFPTSFLLAGAQAVIASNWVVEQNRARAFMFALQECWAGGVTLGEAMRHAYTAVRAEHPHPFHWAAFSLFGNDRLKFNLENERGN